jgi:endonuclease/exonuclease/phosphatase (EEP) superfamily protein YafD
MTRGKDRQVSVISIALRLVAFAAGLVVALATLLGLLAAWFPLLELLNHFRLIWLAGASALFPLALVLGGPRLIWVAATLVAVNLALVGFALTGSAAKAGKDSQRVLRVVSLNVGAQNPRIDLTAEFLLKVDGDVVVLVELRKKQRERLLEQLRSRYPYQLGTRSVMLLSKLPAVASSHQNGRRIDGRPSAPVWARFERHGTTFELAGVHFVRPFTPHQQISETEALIDFANARDVPLIVAGDFNLTPWSTILQRFGMETGLKRSITFTPTWPLGRRRMPFVTIDNVFVSKQFAVVSAEAGPYVGSDHRPIIADLALAEGREK